MFYECPYNWKSLIKSTCDPEEALSEDRSKKVRYKLKLQLICL